MTALQELDQFTRFTQNQLYEDDDALSLEDCLRLWRRQIEKEEVITDIKQGLADIEAGRVVSVEAAFREARALLGIPQ